MTLLKRVKGGRIYSPRDEGVRDILIAGETIVKVAEQIVPPAGLDVETFDASGLTVVPGFVDLHVHAIGGGGEAGPASRVPEITLSELTEAGITTLVGVLGTDNVSRHPETLLAKVKALTEEGITGYMYTGSYHLPSVTITGSVKRDIALIEEVVGVKLAISDHRASQVSCEELARLASEARVGGMHGGKPGLVHVHVGRGAKALTPIFEVVERTDIPIGQFLPTHVASTSRKLEQAIEFAKMGGCIDLTAHSIPSQREMGIGEIVGKILRSGVELGNVTMSSDARGSMPRFDEQGRLVGSAVCKASALLKTLRALIESGTVPLADALTLVTTNPAERLGIADRKGRIAEGKDADLVLLDDALDVKQVFARGNRMVDAGKAVVTGRFEA